MFSFHFSVSRHFDRRTGARRRGFDHPLAARSPRVSREIVCFGIQTFCVVVNRAAGCLQRAFLTSLDEFSEPSIRENLFTRRMIELMFFAFTFCAPRFARSTPSGDKLLHYRNQKAQTRRRKTSEPIGAFGARAASIEPRLVRHRRHHRRAMSLRRLFLF